MLKHSILDSEKQHLAELLEAIQRCVYFLDASGCKLAWPLTAKLLETTNVYSTSYDTCRI